MKSIYSNSEIQQPPLADIVAEKIKEKIWRKEYQFGQRLIETNIAEELNVSRSTVREALRKLSHDKLILNIDRKGTFVSEFTEKDINEINEIRTLLEIPALIQASSFLTEKDEKVLIDILNDLNNKVNENNWYEAFNLDMDFHLYLINLCDNSRIIDVYNSLFVQIRTIITDSQNYYEDKKDLYVYRHEELLNAIKLGEVGKIKEMTKDHIIFLEVETKRSK